MCNHYTYQHPENFAVIIPDLSSTPLLLAATAAPCTYPNPSLSGWWSKGHRTLTRCWKGTVPQSASRGKQESRWGKQESRGTTNLGESGECLWLNMSHDYVITFVSGRWSQVLYLQTAILRGKKLFCESLANLVFFFRGVHCLHTMDMGDGPQDMYIYIHISYKFV